MSDEYQVRIKGNLTDDDGLRVEIHVEPNDFWGNLQRGDCPDCGGNWVWAEAGHVPGTRECECGSLYTVLGSRHDDDGGDSAHARHVAVLRRERLF